jgi:DNA mismatch repair protein MutL
MGRIVILDENTSNQIAAGEVVERPASVVKELVENSIDAGSTSISVEISNGGVSLIKVVDSGSGMEEDDVEIAFDRHATSKIRNSHDLEAITTLGFRGEALASIASVATVEITTRVKDNEYGKYVRIQGGVLKETNRTGCPIGTTIVVKELFYNTPARYKFLKKDTTEAGYISDIVSRIALGKPHISMRFISNRKTVIHTPGNSDLLSTIFSIYGKETAKECVEIVYEDEKIKITGYAGKPEIARSNRNHQSIYINGRYIKNKIISAAIDEAYKTFLLKNKFAFVVLNLEINPVLVDVNVHPTKMEVRFSGEQDIFRAVYHAISNALLSKSLIRNVELSEKSDNYFKFNSSSIAKDEFIQQGLKSSSEDTPVLKQHPASLIAREETAPVINGHEKFEASKNEFTKSPEMPKKPYEKQGVNKIESVMVAEQPEIVKKRDVSDAEKTKSSFDKVLEKKDTVYTDNYKDNFLKEESNDKESNDKEPNNNVSRCDPKEITDYSGDKDTAKNILLNSNIIGQVFFTYILLQNEDNLIVIDQHAAHERIMFEKLVKRYRNKENLAQFLLTSEVIELTGREIGFIEEEKELLGSLGFTFENFGSSSVILRSVPYNCQNSCAKEVFLKIVDLLMSGEKRDDKIIEEEALYQIACKSAIKANLRLTEIEIKSMIKELMEIENPYTCPHGRPTIIKITKYEFEKMFKRII